METKFNPMLGFNEVVETSRPFKPKIDRLDDSPDRVKKLAESALVDFTAERPDEPSIIKDVRNDQPFMALGSFSLVLGRAKSRKTHLNAFLAAVFIRGHKGDFQASLPIDKPTVIFFDTEQSGGEAWDVANKIRHAGQMTDPAQFLYYSLREVTPRERVEIIAFVLNETPTAGVVFIDGIRDLVSNINDPNEATEAATRLMQWTKLHKIHIVCTLHYNKGDGNARGHLGTELVNKAQTIISIDKPTDDAPFSIVHFVDGRGRGFLDFALTYDDEGLPVQQDIETETRSKPGKAAFSPQDLPMNEHCNRLEGAINEGVTYNELVQTIRELYGIGERKAKMQFLPYLKTDLGIIVKAGEYYFFKSPHQAKDLNEDDDALPF